MAARAIINLPGITPSRVPVQPRQPKAEDQNTYRNTLGDISATLGIIKQLEPYLAQLGYTQNPNAKQPEVSARNRNNPHADAQTNQVVDAFSGGAQPGGPAEAPSRMGAAPMAGNERRGPEMSTDKDAALQSFLAEMHATQQAVARLDPGMEAAPLEQLPWQMTGDPVPPQRPSMAGADAAIAAIQPTTEQGEMRRANAQRNIANRKEAEQMQAALDAPSPQMQGAQAVQSELQAGAPQQPIQPPMPTAQEYTASQNAALDLLADTDPQMAADGREIQRAEALPRFDTYAQAKAAMGAAVARGDADLAARIIEGASVSPLRDVVPLTFTDRISSAHITRAMNDLSGDARGVAGLSLRAKQAEAIQRHREAQLNQREQAMAHRKRVDDEKARVAAEKLDISRNDLWRKTQESTARIDKMEIETGLKQEMQSHLIRLRDTAATKNTAQASQAWALANTFRKTLPGKLKNLFRDEMDAVTGYSAAQDAAADAGLPGGEGKRITSLEDVAERLKRGEAVAPRKQGDITVADEKAKNAASVKSAAKLTEQTLGLGGGAGSRGDKPSDKDRRTTQTIKETLDKGFAMSDGFVADDKAAVAAVRAARKMVARMTDKRAASDQTEKIEARIALLPPVYQTKLKGESK